MNKLVIRVVILVSPNIFTHRCAVRYFKWQQTDNSIMELVPQG